jgi:hypothetical protein
MTHRAFHTPHAFCVSCLSGSEHGARSSVAVALNLTAVVCSAGGAAQAGHNHSHQLLLALLQQAALSAARTRADKEREVTQTAQAVRTRAVGGSLGAWSRTRGVCGLRAARALTAQPGAPRHARPMHHRRGRDGAAGRGAPSGALWARKPTVARAALVLLACLLLLACWAASWTGELVYPTTIQQAEHWRPRTESAAVALLDVPRSAQVVELVISRFSGNLSWVPGVVALLGVNKVVVYCKARRPGWVALRCAHVLPAMRASRARPKRPAPSRALFARAEPGGAAGGAAVHAHAAQRGQRGAHVPVAHHAALGRAAGPARLFA